MVYRNFSSDLRHLVSDVLKVIEIKINIDAYDLPPPSVPVCYWPGCRDSP